MTKLKRMWNWSPAATVLGGLILALWLSAVVWSQGQNFGNAASLGGAPTKWINIATAPYNAIGDARDVTCGTTSGSPNVTSAALFLASDAGKEIYIYTTNNGNGFTIGTILSVTDTSNIVLSGNALQSVGAHQCHIGTNNGAAIIAAGLALGANQALYMPGGTYMIDCRQILSNGGLASSIGAVEVFGDGMGVSEIWFSPNCTNWTSGTTQVISANNVGTYWHDFSVRPGPEQANVTSNVANADLANLYGNRVERVRVSNFNSTSPLVYCIVSNTDGTHMTAVESSGCAGGLDFLWKTITLLNANISGTVNGVRLFDQSGTIVGGEISGSTCGILAQFQGAPADFTISGAAVSGATAYCGSGSGTVARIEGGRYGFGLGNQTGINLSAGAIAYVHNVSLAPAGTGFGINNSGTFYDLGGIKFESAASGNYTGSGTLVNYAAEPSVGGRCLLASAAGPLACVNSANGKVAIPASLTSYTINTTAVASGSVITLTPTTDNTGIPGSPTCTLPPVTSDPNISATVAGTSFTISEALIASITCYNWSIR